MTNLYRVLPDQYIFRQLCSLLRGGSRLIRSGTPMAQAAHRLANTGRAIIAEHGPWLHVWSARGGRR